MKKMKEEKSDEEKQKKAEAAKVSEECKVRVAASSFHTLSRPTLSGGKMYVKRRQPYCRVERHR